MRAPSKFHSRTITFGRRSTSLVNRCAISKITIALVSFAVILTLAPVPRAEARNTKYNMPIAGVTENPEYKDSLGSDVAYFFADQPTPKIDKTLGEYVTNKKTNSANKSDEKACQWAFLSALLQLRDRAKEEGGNAVVNIVSYYQKDTFSSRTDYECHAGAVIAGVALKGTVAKLAK